MAEFFGVCRPRGLSSDHLEAFSRMRMDLLSLRRGQSRVTEATTCALGVVAHHDQDPVSFRVEDGTGAVVAWLGRAPEDHGRLAVSDLEAALGSADGGWLRTAAPPFAFALRSSDATRMWLASDPFGLHPVYYAEQAGLLAFATKLRPLLCCGLFDWELDTAALLDFLTYEHVTGERTLADCARLVPSGSVISIDDGGVQLRSYSGPLLPGDGARLDARDLAAQLHEELSRSTARAIHGRSRVALTLSGGLDSRALLGAALEQSVQPRTYTFGDKACVDVRYARELASRTGLSHAMLEIRGGYLQDWLDHGVYVTGGMVSCIHFHILSLADQLAEEADVVLDGLAGDALSGGHLSWGMMMARSAEVAMDRIYRRRATAWATRAGWSRIIDPDRLAESDHEPRDQLRVHFEGLEGAPLWWGCHRFDLAERQRRFIQFGPHLLRPLVDVQTPFYSPALVDLMKAAPARHLIEQNAYQQMIARYYPALARVPDSARGVPLSWHPSARFAKRAFDFTARRLPLPAAWAPPSDQALPTSYATWLRTDLRQLVEERLLDAPSCYDGVLRRDGVEALVREHVSGTADHSVRLGCLMSLTTWLHSVSSSEIGV